MNYERKIKYFHLFLYFCILISIQKNMYKRIIRKFSYSSPYLKDLHKFSGKVNLNQTIKDKRNLQRFLENQVKDGKIKSTIQRTSKYDKEFSEFLKEYQAKNRDSPNIIDISHYARNHESFNKSFEQRKEEIIMLDEFRKRRQEEIRVLIFLFI